ncbi:hypothetical protein GCM10010327_11250 [Streptomyces nitrosporeus]|nr:hypothetical protein GCM10010327_11250 [Streptomyces nitrosporeus]
MSCFKQALPTLAHLRKNETFAQVGAGFGVFETTAWRHVDETLQIRLARRPACRRRWPGWARETPSSSTAP